MDKLTASQIASIVDVKRGQQLSNVQLLFLNTIGDNLENGKDLLSVRDSFLGLNHAFSSERVETGAAHSLGNE